MSDPPSIPLDKRRPLVLGDVGSDVADLQCLLPEFSGASDGWFGPATKQAVVDYQRSRGLIVDGVCGPMTWQALYEDFPPLGKE